MKSINFLEKRYNCFERKSIVELAQNLKNLSTEATK